MTNEVPERELIPAHEIQIDAFAIADAAQMREGLMFAMSMGWTMTWPPPDRPEYPFTKPISVCLLFRVPWGLTDREHRILVRFLDSDENPLEGEPKIEGTFRVGRGAQLEPGMTQVAGVGATIPVSIPQPGIYQLVLSVNEEERRRIQFQSLAGPPGR